jgi:stringent starvation protein A
MTLVKRSVMQLYSGEMDIYSHQVRIVLAEKGVAVEVLNVAPDQLNEDLAQLNPYNSLPTLVDRELVLYNPQVVMEYLDERFPHPPLWPVYPVARAKSRLLMYRIHRDWYSLLSKIEGDDPIQRDRARQDLCDGLVALEQVFSSMTYFLSDDFTLVDCCIGPLLWRLPEYGVDLPKKAKGIHEYAERVFARDTFQASLTESEREIREAVGDF